MIIFKNKLILDCWIPAAIGMASAVAGHMMQRNAAEALQEDAQAFNSAEAQKNRDYQQNMYMNRYLYTMQDMYRAGLNPILAATQGGLSGGSIPQGSSATSGMNNVSMPDFASSAKNLTESEFAEEQAETEESKRSLNFSKATEAIANEYQARAQAGLATAQEKQAIKGIEKIEAEVEKLKQEAKTSAGLEEVYNMEKEKIDLMRQQLKNDMAKIEKMSKVYSNWGGQLIAYFNALFGEGRVTAPTISIVKGLR